MTITADVEGAEVVLDGQGTTRVVYITSGTVQLVGLDITNGHGSSGGGVYVYAGTATFTGCAIYNNLADSSTSGLGGGVYVLSGTATFTGCEIFSNTANNVRIGPAPFHGPNGRLSWN